MDVEAALFGEDIESILKLILKFAILAKPNQTNKIKVLIIIIKILASLSYENSLLPTSYIKQKMNEQLYVVSLFVGGHSSLYLIF